MCEERLDGSVEDCEKELAMDFNETSADGKIRLRTQNCFKKCKDGPNIMINGKFYHHMDTEKTKRSSGKNQIKF